MNNIKIGNELLKTLDFISLLDLDLGRLIKNKNK